LIATRNFLEIPQDFVLSLVLSEDLCWPEHVLYLACYFWSKYQACQQLETILEEMSSALGIVRRSLILQSEDLHENSSGDEKMQAIIEVDPATVKACMEPFLPHIRLLSMHGSTLERILREFCCFSSVEKNMIYSSFVGLEFACLPEEFCKIKVPRPCLIQSVIYMFGYFEKETDDLTLGELPYHNIISKQFFPDLQRYLIELEIRFPTQRKPSRVESESYEELFTVIVTNHKNEKHVTGPLTRSVKYNSLVRIFLHPGLEFHCGRNELSVKILHHRSGLYPTYEPKLTTLSFDSLMKFWVPQNFFKPYPEY
jgi:hypothetical protein